VPPAAHDRPEATPINALGSSLEASLGAIQLASEEAPPALSPARQLLLGAAEHLFCVSALGLLAEADDGDCHGLPPSLVTYARRRASAPRANMRVDHFLLLCCALEPLRHELPRLGWRGPANLLLRMGRLALATVRSELRLPGDNRHALRLHHQHASAVAGRCIGYASEVLADAPPGARWQDSAVEWWARLRETVDMALAAPPAAGDVLTSFRFMCEELAAGILRTAGMGKPGASRPCTEWLGAGCHVRLMRWNLSAPVAWPPTHDAPFDP
jgi:hypothetical protein